MRWARQTRIPWADTCLSGRLGSVGGYCLRNCRSRRGSGGRSRRLAPKIGARNVQIATEVRLGLGSTAARPERRIEERPEAQSGWAGPFETSLEVRELDGSYGAIHHVSLDFKARRNSGKPLAKFQTCFDRQFIVASGSRWIKFCFSSSAAFAHLPGDIVECIRAVLHYYYEYFLPTFCRCSFVGPRGVASAFVIKSF